ncbi:flagellar basal body rod protein FlgB [Methylobacterium phyllosphaerae]|uniref:Flagellar basal body rod protein FlgB n=1 Tax=Methylobacterium phyllosphaerae TaxID=418223 RepID=A0AAE8HMP3_9HYPH|nr:flagellar basal body protein [Methylobacterium phyllosphaerae]APT30625.1 flagellar basal body rod protein FlgB [Methylobacterium phyllosphaerae]SFG22057.1 flagellar basal-body rod protein FlgB [Methylobacterium phyllosphaerae]
MNPIFLFNIASRQLQHLAARQAVIAGNIANANTPGYRARDLTPFRDLMDKTALTMAATHTGHLEANGAGTRPARATSSAGWDVVHSGNRISQLEAKRAEYEEWLKRRQAFLAKADESVTAIYARMRPEAAAQQLTAMDSEAAAAILTRLDARIASAILNEMEPGRAARLANVITNTPPKKPTPQRPGEAVKAQPQPRMDEGDRHPQDSETSG